MEYSHYMGQVNIYNLISGVKITPVTPELFKENSELHINGMIDAINRINQKDDDEITEDEHSSSDEEEESSTS